MTQTSRPPVIQIENLKFSYPNATQPTIEIQDLLVTEGERLFLHGPSGTGKSTLLGLIAGILSPQTGSLTILGQDWTRLSLSAKDRLRGSLMGYIFQMFNLIPYLTVLDNIVLPCRMNRTRQERIGKDLAKEVTQIAEGLGIQDLLAKKVTQLSVGQQQRVAAARALLGRPPILIADEPTSALDLDNRESFIKLLFDQADHFRSTILFVSHDHSLAHLFSRRLPLAELNRASQ